MCLSSILISWLPLLSNWCQNPSHHFQVSSVVQRFFTLFFSRVAGTRNPHHILLNVCSIVCVDYLIAILPVLLLSGHLSNIL